MLVRTSCGSCILGHNGCGRGAAGRSLLLPLLLQPAIGAALNALRLSISGDAETIGVSKKGQVFFVAFPLLVAAASFATLEPSELLSP